MTLLFLITGCHLFVKLESRIQKPQHSHPPTYSMSIVPLSLGASLAKTCHCIFAWQSPLLPGGHGHKWHHGEESTCAREASGGTSGRMTTERVVRFWKRLPKEVMESTSGLITLERFSCKKVSTQSGNSSRTDVLTFLSLMQDKG